MPLSNSFEALKEAHNSKFCCEQIDDDVYNPILNEDIIELASYIVAAATNVMSRGCESN